MSRIFLSHASTDDRKAIALKQWLGEQNPRLANEIFLDLDSQSGIRTGELWKEALRKANARCEAVVCLLSAEWESRVECLLEYRHAELLNKRVFCARLEPSTGTKTSAWQWCDLFGYGAMTDIDLADGGPPIQFATAGLYQLRDGIRGAGIGADAFVWPVDDPNRAPYRGWQPFEPVDAGIFFGRDAQILRALDAIRGMRKSKTKSWFVVLGPSGTGKSSFLRAGLLPRLQRDDREFLVLGIVRPERNVLRSAEGLATSIYLSRRRFGLSTPELGDIRAACENPPGTLRALLEELQDAARAHLLERGEESEPPTLVLPIDQAEELLAPEGARPSAAFLRIIRDLQAPAAGAGLDLIVAATIRSDRFEGLQTRPELANVESELFGGLKPMPSEQFERVITGPAERATESARPLELDPNLVERLLEDCREGSDTLPLLSLTLWRLYENYGASGKLTLAHYDKLGGLRKVVQSVIDGIFAEDLVVDSQLELARSAFIPWLATINPDSDQPMRRVAQWSEMPEASRSIVDQFVRDRLLVKDRRDGDIVVEVALESLLRQWDDLVSWLNAQRHELKATEDLERATARWEAANDNDAWLFTGSRLAAAEALFELPGFRERVAHCRDFVDASRRREDAGRHGAVSQADSAKGLPTWRDRWRLRMARSVHVVVDVDDDAVSLVDRLRGVSDGLVVVVGDFSQTARLRALRGRGVIAIAGALNRPDFMGDLPIPWRNLAALYLLSADSAANLRRLEVAGELRDSAKWHRVPVTVRIDDPWQAASWRARFLGGADARWAADAISKYEVTAAQLLDHIAGYEQISRLYICGGSVLTLALCAEVARRRVMYGYYSGAGTRQPPSVTLIGHNAEELVRDVEHRERATVGLADIEWLDAIGDFPTLAALSEVLVRHQGGGRSSECAIVFVDDAAAVPDTTLGSRLVSRFPNVPVFVWGADAADLADSRPVIGELHAYRLSMQRLTGPTSDLLEEAAMLIHARFASAVPTPTPAARPWQELDTFSREGQRRSVRNVLYLVEAIGNHTWDTFGAVSAPLPDLRNLEPTEQLTILGFDRRAMFEMARALHEDWCDYHRRAGWTFAPRRDNARRHHDLLIPWEDVITDRSHLDKAIHGLSATILSLRELGYRSRPTGEAGTVVSVTAEE